MTPDIPADGYRYRSAMYPDHWLESFGVHYSNAAWRNETGGYVGHADWRNEHGMGSRSYCGHKHFSEACALKCIQERHEIRKQEGE